MVKNLPASERDRRDVGLIPGLGRSPGGGNGNLLQYSCLGNSLERRLAGYKSTVGHDWACTPSLSFEKQSPLCQINGSSGGCWATFLEVLVSQRESLSGVKLFNFPHRVWDSEKQTLELNFFLQLCLSQEDAFWLCSPGWSGSNTIVF